jgi:hypothetical protein
LCFVVDDGSVCADIGFNMLPDLPSCIRDLKSALQSLG